MSLKDFAKQQLFDFFVITTFCNVAIFVLGSMYKNGNMFSYEVLLVPLLYGFFGTLPSWILYSKKELTMKQMLIRKVFQFVALEILLTFVTFHGGNLKKENITVIISFMISVLAVSVCVSLVSWMLETREAKILTEELINYQSASSDN